ncbi:barstar family protein [Streptomyces sp. NPDC001228]|uniref:barstar family protein n=1 Tax=Streptomyces sp. NPDC001228 TaxID=3154381 RepID=UPI003330E5DC
MTSFDLAGTSQPWVVCVPQGSSEIRGQLAELSAKGGRVHRFDARDLMTVPDTYRALARTLRFPGYFGGNWDAVVDCLDDLCDEVTGGVGVAGVVHDADPLLETEHFPLFVSVLCQGADRANSAVDLDGDPLDRPAVAEHFVLEFSAFDPERIARRIAQKDLVVTVGDGFVGAALDPEEWH